MSEYIATVRWQRGEQAFLDNRYSRAHVWQFDGGCEVPASASPHIVPLPYSVAANVDPEEALVAALSSCHMLFFLSIAAKKRLVVDSYTDAAFGVMDTDRSGRQAMTRVTLRPCVHFGGDRQPTRAQLEQMHHQSHDSCFIANSVKTEVVTEIVVAAPV
ncbi:OsmC family peroxiredoxin [Exilibacterium tricleocarpae]|uniref:OsmC family peroxiredoxin n=1 Tax=Exilibacterium tricleocarpae TaxID=2591008 RepID=A0A545TYW5_9GAMM|nr:OsmC family protein [Exilibacterium tricleocarpae]TQV82419.1 OsmC family peroxiredoxin [Exilibacterium tricleocarpae]